MSLTKTSDISIYLLNQNENVDNAIDLLINDLNYEEILFRNEIQQANSIKISAFVRNNSSRPDWVDFIYTHVAEMPKLSEFYKCDLVILIESKKSDGESLVFVIFKGSGYFGFEDKLDHNFGISILERVFDQNSSKIQSIDEKILTGDVLVNRRYYRYARPLAYEEDFARLKQNIGVILTDDQIKRHFPTFAKRRGDKLKNKIIISGSSNLHIKTKILFIELIFLIKDISKLISEPEPPHIFNRFLIPLNDKRDKELISSLNETAINNLVKYCEDPIKYQLDYDFRYKNFEQYFESTKCKFYLQGLSYSHDKKNILVIDDIFNSEAHKIIREIVSQIKMSIEYKNTQDKLLFLTKALNSVQVTTLDEDDEQITNGHFIEYIQQMTMFQNISYFLLDGTWFKLCDEFNQSLNDKYKARISENIRSYPFIHKWNNVDETSYNFLYDNQPISLCLHTIKVDLIELCDALHFDTNENKLYIIHVKDGMGASIRDLTSQALMSAHLIEHDVLTGNKEAFIKLYNQGVQGKRIDPDLICLEDFLLFISTFKKEYILAIHSDSNSVDEIRQGKFFSRIAKFSLIKFANDMQDFNSKFSICVIPE